MRTKDGDTALLVAERWSAEAQQIIKRHRQADACMTEDDRDWSLHREADERDFVDKMAVISRWHWRHRDVTISIGPNSMGAIYGPTVEVERGGRKAGFSPAVSGYNNVVHELNAALARIEGLGHWSALLAPPREGYMIDESGKEVPRPDDDAKV